MNIDKELDKYKCMSDMKTEDRYKKIIKDIHKMVGEYICEDGQSVTKGIKQNIESIIKDGGK